MAIVGNPQHDAPILIGPLEVNGLEPDAAIGWQSEVKHSGGPLTGSVPGPFT